MEHLTVTKVMKNEIFCTPEAAKKKNLYIFSSAKKGLKIYINYRKYYN